MKQTFDCPEHTFICCHGTETSRARVALSIVSLFLLLACLRKFEVCRSPLLWSDRKKTFARRENWTRAITEALMRTKILCQRCVRRRDDSKSTREWKSFSSIFWKSPRGKQNPTSASVSASTCKENSEQWHRFQIATLTRYVRMRPVLSTPCNTTQCKERRRK